MKKIAATTQLSGKLWWYFFLHHFDFNPLKKLCIQVLKELLKGVWHNFPFAGRLRSELCIKTLK
jgi:hypothetical protein